MEVAERESLRAEPWTWGATLEHAVQRNGIKVGERGKAWVNEWVSHEVTEHFLFLSQGSWGWMVRDEKMLNPSSTMPITVTPFWQPNTFPWHARIPRVLNGTRDPLIFLFYTTSSHPRPSSTSPSVASFKTPLLHSVFSQSTCSAPYCHKHQFGLLQT